MFVINILEQTEVRVLAVLTDFSFFYSRFRSKFNLYFINSNGIRDLVVFSFSFLKSCVNTYKFISS